MERRQYQDEAADWLSKTKVGLLVAPAGSGKTLIVAAAIDRVLARKPRLVRVRIGWMANTIEQCGQAAKALAAFPAIAKAADVRIECAAADSDWTQTDLLVVDEAHHATALLWRKQIASAMGALWGMTATKETGDEDRDAELIEMFAGNVHEIDRSKVQGSLSHAKVVLLNDTDPDLEGKIDERIEALKKQRRKFWKVRIRRAAEETIQRLSIVPRVLDDDKAKESAELVREAEKTIATIDAEIHKMVAWAGCVGLGICANGARNRKVVALARKHEADMTLILVNEIEHGKDFVAQIPGSILCTSKMGRKQRTKALADFAAGHCRCIVATSLADEGLDLPMANVLILVSGGRSKVKTEQRTGRVLRTWAGKAGAIIYDFEDRQHPMMRRHALARQSLYKRLGYSIEQAKHELDFTPQRGLPVPRLDFSNDYDEAMNAMSPEGYDQGMGTDNCS